MPKKWNEARHGEKLAQLIFLLVTGKDAWSLGELAGELACSKQTVLRLMDIVKRRLPMAPDEREGNRVSYRVDRARLARPCRPIGYEEMAILEMCRAFTENLLGPDHYRRATDALRKAWALMPPSERVPDERLFGCHMPGSIDYTKHQAVLQQLAGAMDARRVCRLFYRGAGAEREKVFDVMPLKLFAHRGTVYLHTRMYREGEKLRPDAFDPLLAVHRIQRVMVRQKYFDYPSDYDFDAVFNRTFGVVKGESFRVKAIFSDWAVDYARERLWSPDQELRDLPGGELELSFTASSEWETASWVLSYRGAARVVEPDWLVREVRRAARRVVSGHAGRRTPADA